MSQATEFATSLTAETSPAGFTTLYISTVGSKQLTVTLEPAERARLIEAMQQPGTTHEITRY